MIGMVNFDWISDIFLTVSLIVLLLFYEFGDDEAKKQFFPFIVVMSLVFLIVAFLNIYSQIR